MSKGVLIFKKIFSKLVIKNFEDYEESLAELLTFQRTYPILLINQFSMLIIRKSFNDNTTCTKIAQTLLELLLKESLLTLLSTHQVD